MFLPGGDRTGPWAALTEPAALGAVWCGPAHRPDAAELVRLSAATASALREVAARAAEGPLSGGVHSAARPVRAPKVIFFFSGRGSQWVGMGGRGLLDREPAPDYWQFTLGRETWVAGDHVVGGRTVASGAMLLGRPAGGPRGAARRGLRHLRPGSLPGPLVIGENGTRVMLVLRREVPDGGARARLYDVDGRCVAEASIPSALPPPASGWRGSSLGRSTRSTTGRWPGAGSGLRACVPPGAARRRGRHRCRTDLPTWSA